MSAAFVTGPTIAFAQALLGTAGTFNPAVASTLLAVGIVLGFLALGTTPGAPVFAMSPQASNATQVRLSLGFGTLGVVGAFVQYSGVGAFGLVGGAAAVVEAFAVAWPFMLGMAAFCAYLAWRRRRAA